MAILSWPVEERGPGESRFFGDTGLSAEQLHTKFSFDPVEVDVGKIAPAFGIAWDETPGVYGKLVAEDYELVEKAGIGFSVSRKNTAIGNLTLRASTFFAETSALSQSAFTNRGKLDRDDGGLSNTESFDSFAVALEGEDIPGLKGVSYNIGFVHQAGGVNDLSDQNGVVFGMKGERTYNNVEFEWIGETAYFDYGGDLYDAGDPALFVDTLWYYTLGAQATFNDKYRINAAYTGRNAVLFDGTDFHDYQYSASIGVKMWRDWWLDAGYRLLRVADADSQFVGLELSKTIEFDTGKLEPMKK